MLTDHSTTSADDHLSQDLHQQQRAAIFQPYLRHHDPHPPQRSRRDDLRRKLNGFLPEAPPVSPFRFGRIKSSPSSSSQTTTATTEISSVVAADESEASSSGYHHQQQQTQQQDVNRREQQQQQQRYHITSEYDRDPQIQYGSSLFTNTNDNNNNESNSSSINNRNRNTSNNSDSNNDNSNNNNDTNNVSAWAPEDYPDPWTNPTLCGGASTTSSSGGVVGGDGVADGIQTALFCDPDQVLDRDMLLSVTSKLREFAQSFASSSSTSPMMDITEGVEFGGGRGAVREEGGATGRDADPKRAYEEEKHRQPLPPPQENDVMNNLSRLLAAPDAVGGMFSTTEESELQSLTKISGVNSGDGSGEVQKIEIAIALVKKIDLPAILRADSYFYYSDQDDMVNDAAQYFARYIHDNWSRYLAREQNSSSINIVLVFISTLDRICYISSGNRLAAVLPWWRLEHVVQDMKQDLQRRQIGDAILIAIEDLTSLLIDGPPSFRDRVNDFLQRFGIVLLFTIFTFTFATLGECRESRRRIFFADRRSRMNPTERENARLLQKVFRTMSCPICLEPFEPDITTTIDMDQSLEKHRQKSKRIDSYGIPLIGTDDKPIKLLRCGHIFDMTCWQMWVDSGQGNVLICPVCRQDVGASKRESRHSRGAVGVDDIIIGRAEEGRHSEQSSLFTRLIANASGPSMLLRPVNNTTRQNYNAIPLRSEPIPTRVLIDRQHSAPTIMQLSMHSIHGELTTSEIDEFSSEQTPFFSQVTRGNRAGNYY